MQPILVKKHINDQYMIVAGERRWRAANLAQHKEIPAIIVNQDNQNNYEISLIRNKYISHLNFC